MHSILLAGALLAGLPVLLHLIMKQEPKRVPFPAFRFLKLKHKTNQRKMRLRHFLLLAMRVLLIALFAAALYQPTLLSEGFLDIRGEQPLAVVVVVDTSPSMGYVADNKTRLEEAKRRALELLDALPAGSRVAVVETGEPGGDWLPSVADARRRLDALTAPKGDSRPVTAALVTAYQLLRTVDEQTEATEPLPRLVAVFTDRAAASWDATRTDDLKKLRDAVPDPKPVQAVVDVGVEPPTNVAITAAEVRPHQVVPGNVPAVVGVTVAAAGPDVEVGVRCRLDGAPTAERRAVTVPGGQSRPVEFTFNGLKPGLHQAEVSLDAADRLAFDNTRFVTFRVAEPRRILTISDDPDDARWWALAHNLKGDFACEVVTPQQAVAPDFKFAPFEVVCLLSVAGPNHPGEAPLWGKLLPYVSDGGKLVIIPGGDDTLLPAEYDPTKPTQDNAANLLMPGTLKRVVDAAAEFPEPPKPADPKAPRPPDRRAGVSWFVGDGGDDRPLAHPMLAPFKEWKRRGNIDFLKYPPRARKFWEVEPVSAPGVSVVVRYDENDDPAKRRPALLERAVGKAGGKVVLLTTRMDVPLPGQEEWHDYWRTEGSSWFAVFPSLVVKSLAGDTADANFNHPTGQTVPVPLPRGDLPTGPAARLVLDGPGVSGADAEIPLAGRQTELRLGPPRTDVPGNYTVSTPDRKWTDGFSLNVPAEEGVLDKVPAAAVEELTGAGTVIPVEKDLKLSDLFARRFTQPVDLFPWLLIGVLLLMAVEGLVAGRFYRKPGA